MPLYTGVGSRARKGNHPHASEDVREDEVSDNGVCIDHKNGSDKAEKILLLFLILSEAGSQ
jgi:hypothetical protein